MATTQFCLTDAGTNLVGPTVSLLSDLDNFITPFQTGISLGLLQPPNCPVTLTVPNNATIVKVYDQNTNSCAYISLSGNDLCNLYNLTITDLQTTTISQIIIGDFVTSLGPVSDYVIYWYRNNETTPQYITGKGSRYSGYIAGHPLTGSAAILAQSGEYSIKIAKMYIDGVDFSTLDTPETGFVKVITSCIPTVLVTVTALNCNNGTFTSTDSSLVGYSHKYEFNNASVGTTPQALFTTFDLSDTTNYFAFAFQANSIPDRLKITFSGDAYSEPIVLENINVGLQGVSGNYIPSSQIKATVTNGLFKKVLNLTQLVRTTQDFLVIEVTPNQTNNQTIWTLYLKCLTTIDCTSCTDQFNNVPAKLVGSQTTSNVLLIPSPIGNIDCGQIVVSSQMQACSTSSLDNADLNKYFSLSFNGFRATSGTNPPFYKTVSTQVNALTRTCNSSAGSSGSSPQCGTNPNGTVNYSSTVTTNQICITATFTDTANFNIFFNSFTTNLTSNRNNYPNYSNYLSDDFYVYLNLRYPNGIGCGDQIPTGSIYIPLWCTYTNTVNSLTICFDTIPSNYITEFITVNDLSYCDINCIQNFQTQVNRINNLINTYNINPLNVTNSSGGYYSNSFGSVSASQIPEEDELVGYYGLGSATLFAYSNTTYMMSGNPLVLINTTPIKACDFESIGGWTLNTNVTYNVNSQLGSYVRFDPAYRIRARNPRNDAYPTDVTIEGQTRTNGQNSGAYVIAYQKFNDVVTTNSTFII